MELCCQADWNSDGVVVKFLLAEQEARDFDSQSHHYDFRDWLSPASKSQFGWKHHQSDVNPQNNKPGWNIIDKYKGYKKYQFLAISAH